MALKGIECSTGAAYSRFFKVLSGNQLVIGKMQGGFQLVTRHRVNLSLSDADFQRLSEQAAQEGKTPSTFALDVLKAYMLRNKFPATRRPVQEAKPAQAASMPGQDSKPAHKAVEVAGKYPALSRQERRALERKMKKARGE